MISAAIQQRLGEYAERFQQAQPFRHVVMDGFFDEAAVHGLLAQFPAFDPGRARNENGTIGNKAVYEQIRELGPAYAALDRLVASPAFLAMIGELTGIRGLLYDPHYFGGGTHDNRHGQSLDVHVDFNRHPVTHTHRRLNLIVYLNPEWHEEWGGLLELHRDPRAADDQVEWIAPQLNRAVLFETTESSWHGFSPITLPAERATLSRRSIALYFYSAERPSAELGQTHSTVYVDRPLPARISEGRVLDHADVAELQALLATRDQHIQRLYRDAQASQDRLERQLRRFGLARGSWLYRTLARLGRRLR